MLMNSRLKTGPKESATPMPVVNRKPGPDRNSGQVGSFATGTVSHPKKETGSFLVVIEHFAEIRRAQMNGTKPDMYGAEEVVAAIGKLTPAEKKRIQYYIEKLANISPHEEVRKAAGAVTY